MEQRQNKKILVIIPDGVALRNFVYSGFSEIAEKKGVDLTFWNDSALDLSTLGLREIRYGKNTTHPVTHALKYSKKKVALDLNAKKTGDRVYQHYYFSPPKRYLKDKLVAFVANAVSRISTSEKGLDRIDRAINYFERKTGNYRMAREVLQKERPDVLFCTNQRHFTTIAPMLAARDLGIPTATFIFSWDNLPKATLVVDSDYYFVWSDHMKSELQFYHPRINAEQIFATGTPQFDAHAKKDRLLSRSDFFAQHGLDTDKRYICFSGDDVTTSPHDPIYLKHTAEAVRELQKEGFALGILFRRCPVDFSGRYDQVLAEFADVIVPIAPDWQKIGGSWGHVVPTENDMVLQQNTIAHTEMVINLGSSMVFDFAAFDKPCAFINYNVAEKTARNWSVERTYSFVHFRSMPSKDVVIWLDSPQSIASAIKATLEGRCDSVPHARTWFEKIALKSGQACDHIVEALLRISAN